MKRRYEPELWPPFEIDVSIVEFEVAGTSILIEHETSKSGVVTGYTLSSYGPEAIGAKRLSSWADLTDGPKLKQMAANTAGIQAQLVRPVLSWAVEGQEEIKDRSLLLGLPKPDERNWEFRRMMKSGERSHDDSY